MPAARERDRLASLDAFRGFAVASMMLVNNPGDWSHVHSPLLHAPWNGWTFTDLVFPFFLFIAGVSLALSTDRRLRDGTAPSALIAQFARRALVIFAVGLALNGFPAYDFATIRIPGVLQRIALCVVVAAPFAALGSHRAVAAGIAGLLLAYSVPMLLVPVPDEAGVVAAGVLEPGRDFGSWLDRLALGPHLWSQSRTWDPEGITSTLPAAASLLFGVLAGRWLLAPGRPAAKASALFLSGLAALAAGLALDGVPFPINKNLWTPTYCVFMTGWSLVAFAAFVAVMDAGPSAAARRSARTVMLPLTIFGMNALFLFALSGFVGRILVHAHVDGMPLKAWLFAPLRALPVPPADASLAWAIAFDLAMFAVAWGMWRMRWFVKA